MPVRRSRFERNPSPKRKLPALEYQNSLILQQFNDKTAKQQQYIEQDKCKTGSLVFEGRATLTSAYSCRQSPAGMLLRGRFLLLIDRYSLLGDETPELASM